VFAGLAVLAAGRPQESSYQPTQYSSLQDAGIVRMDHQMSEDGSFIYGFETTDPIQADVAGQIKQIGEEFGVVMQGSYSFIAQDENGNDVPIQVDWIADENGFQVTGESIPEAIRSANVA